MKSLFFLLTWCFLSLNLGLKTQGQTVDSVVILLVNQSPRSLAVEICAHSFVLAPYESVWLDKLPTEILDLRVEFLLITANAPSSDQSGVYRAAFTKQIIPTGSIIITNYDLSNWEKFLDPELNGEAIVVDPG